MQRIGESGTSENQKACCSMSIVLAVLWGCSIILLKPMHSERLELLLPVSVFMLQWWLFSELNFTDLSDCFKTCKKL